MSDAALIQTLTARYACLSSSRRRDLRILRSIQIGLLAGQRSMTPLNALAGAAREGTLPHDNAERS